jgi:hypothetical protein
MHLSPRISWLDGASGVGLEGEDQSDQRLEHGLVELGGDDE